MYVNGFPRIYGSHNIDAGAAARPESAILTLFSRGTRAAERAGQPAHHCIPL
jgi:hypothetical protein